MQDNKELPIKMRFTDRKLAGVVAYLLPLVVVVWLFLHPRPYEVCIGIATGLVLLYLLLATLRPQRYDFMSRDMPYGTTVPNVVHPALLLSSALLARAFVDYKLLDYSRALAIIVVVGLLGGLALWALIRGARLPLSIAVSSLYGAGLVIQANGLGLSDWKDLRATVVEKQSYSRPAMTVLTLAIDGRLRDFFVGAGAVPLNRGNNVCLKRATGRLGIDVARLGECNDES